jgi:hypothetical protein
MAAKLGRPAERLATGRRFRLAIYDLADDSVPLDFVGRMLGDCSEDRSYIREAIDEYNAYVARLTGCTYAMGLFEVNRQVR